MSSHSSKTRLSLFDALMLLKRGVLSNGNLFIYRIDSRKATDLGLLLPILSTLLRATCKGAQLFSQDRVLNSLFLKLPFNNRINNFLNLAAESDDFFRVNY